MRRFFTGVALLLLVNGLFIPHSVRAISSSIVISQVYGGGGNSGATLRNDFIELFNRGNTTISLAGWSVQYAATTGTSWQVTPLTGLLAPGAHYLVQEAQGAGGTTNLPIPDATGTIPMAAGAGKVALLSSAAAISSGTSCPAGVVDFVGYGTGTNCFEGAAPTATLSNTTAAIRGLAGCRERTAPCAGGVRGDLATRQRRRRRPPSRRQWRGIAACRRAVPPAGTRSCAVESRTSPARGRAARALGVPVLVRGDSQLNAERAGLRAAKRIVYPHLLKVFDGFLNQREIGVGFAAADALVLPSNGAETWGLVVNEAMAAGLPALVSQAAGCAPDLVVHGETGFTFPCGDVGALARLMLKVVPVRSACRAAIPAVTHVDGSGRLHTVERDANPLYWMLIDIFRQLTGVPIVLNTSFNENEPIVLRPAEALDCFLRTDMDVLVMGRHVLTKTS